ncbi:hypothetical protein [Planktothricoides raciborskii]|uniref:Uncharacterized protein n=1 Tax=Planktothricoides raciborskii GIHE-MW2 TaxID=2792601 RepID=A0AAU8JGL0_9CYAN
MEILIILGIFLAIIGWIFYLLVILPIKSIGEAVSSSQDKRKRQLSLQSIDPFKGRVKVTLNRYYGQTEVEGYDGNCKLISVKWERDSFLENLFRKEIEHAEWRMRFISKLNSTDASQWQNILESSWKAIRVLEERDRVAGTLLSKQQTTAIIGFADQALVSLYYRSTHVNNQLLCNEIMQELSQAEKEYEEAEDDIQRKSISTAIKTHQMRLKKQKGVEKNLHLVESELKSLEATLKLVREGILSEISSRHLHDNPRLSAYDSALLELELPILDEIWQSTASAS